LSEAKHVMIKIKSLEMDAQAHAKSNLTLYVLDSLQSVTITVQSFAEMAESEKAKLAMMEILNLAMDVQMFVQSKLDSTVQVNHLFVSALLFQIIQIILEIQLTDYLWWDLQTLI
jgi:hypothetical protein